MTTQTPTPGRVVLYRTDGRNGLVYDLPAIVTVTRASHPGDYPDGRSNPLPVPDEGHVHLTVFTPGGFGTELHLPSGYLPQPAGPDFVGAKKLVPGSGTYVELNVPQAVGVTGFGSEVEPAPRTWRWPL